MRATLALDGLISYSNNNCKIKTFKIWPGTIVEISLVILFGKLSLCFFVISILHINFLFMRLFSFPKRFMLPQLGTFLLSQMYCGSSVIPSIGFSFIASL